MLIFDGLDFQTRVIKLRPKQVDTCVSCLQANSEQNDESVVKFLDSFDYNLFCGVSNYNDKTADINLLDERTQRVTCLAYKEICENSLVDTRLLVDVRPHCQFRICALPDSLSKSF